MFLRSMHVVRGERLSDVLAQSVLGVDFPPLYFFPNTVPVVLFYFLDFLPTNGAYLLEYLLTASRIETITSNIARKKSGEVHGARAKNCPFRLRRYCRRERY